MSKKSDYFFVNIKQVYPTFLRPSALDTEIWEEVLEPYSEEEILAGIKSYRKNVDTGFAPSPAKFTAYLYRPARGEDLKPDLPLSPETYLMEEDIKAGRCKHLFPTYCHAVEYVFNVKLRELYPAEEFKKFSLGQKYRLSVDLGLFADFDEVLDLVYKKGKGA